MSSFRSEHPAVKPFDPGSPAEPSPLLQVLTAFASMLASAGPVRFSLEIGQRATAAAADAAPAATSLPSTAGSVSSLIGGKTEDEPDPIRKLTILEQRVMDSFADATKFRKANVIGRKLGSDKSWCYLRTLLKRMKVKGLLVDDVDGRGYWPTDRPLPASICSEVRA